MLLWIASYQIPKYCRTKDRDSPQPWNNRTCPPCVRSSDFCPGSLSENRRNDRWAYYWVDGYCTPPCSHYVKLSAKDSPPKIINEFLNSSQILNLETRHFVYWKEIWTIYWGRIHNKMCWKLFTIFRCNFPKWFKKSYIFRKNSS